MVKNRSDSYCGCAANVATNVTLAQISLDVKIKRRDKTISSLTIYIQFGRNNLALTFNI